MIARIFVNKDKHYFIEGKRQLGFLYTKFDKEVMNKENMRRILESAVLYSLDFDLLMPPYDDVSQVTLQEKLHESGIIKMKTAKRMGFQFKADTDHIT